jgi:hypothetical protein
VLPWLVLVLKAAPIAAATAAIATAAAAAIASSATVRLVAALGLRSLLPAACPIPLLLLRLMLGWRPAIAAATAAVLLLLLMWLLLLARAAGRKDGLAALHLAQHVQQELHVWGTMWASRSAAGIE